MASVPNYYYYDYSSDEFSTFLSPTFSSSDDSGRLTTPKHDRSLPCSDDGEPVINMVPARKPGFRVPISELSYPRQLGVSEIGVISLPQFNFVSQEKICGGFASDYWPLYDPMACDIPGNEGKSVPEVQEATTKTGRYSIEERKDRILKYLEKRNQRNFKKTIKYACRKALADKRVRVQGRFAKNNEVCHEDQMIVNENINFQKQREFYSHGCDDMQSKQDEEDWLSETIPNLMYFRFTNIGR